MSVNTGGTQQVFIEELQARIAELEEEDDLHGIVYVKALKRIEDLEDKLHECLCGDLETALGRIKELEKEVAEQLIYICGNPD